MIELKQRTEKERDKEPFSATEILWHCAKTWLEASKAEKLEARCGHMNKLEQLELVRLLSDAVLTRLSMILAHDSKDLNLWHAVTDICACLIAWIFPKDLRSKRSNFAIELALCLFMIARSTLWLKRKHHTKRGQQVVRTLPSHLCLVFEQPSSTAIAQYLDMQKMALWHDSPTDHMALYQWFSEHFRYTGIASLFRCEGQKHGGPAMRLIEHLHNTIRTHARDSQKLRYKMARRHAPDMCCFVITRFGPPVMIRALEWYDIHTHAPCANGLRTTPSRRKKVRQRPSRESRPKTSPREAFHSKQATRSILKAELFLQKQGKKKAITNTCRCLPQSFHAAYVYSVKKSFAENEGMGPLNIYDRKWKHLFARWLVTPQSPRCSVCWQRLETTWNMGFLGSTLVQAAQALPKAAQTRAALKKMDGYFAWRRVPSKRIYVCVSEKSCLTPAKQVTYRALNSSTLENKVRCWIKSGLCFLVSREPSWKDWWSHAKHASEACFSTILASPVQQVRQALLGINFNRPLLNWKVEYRRTEQERVETLHTEITNKLQVHGLKFVANRIGPQHVSSALVSHKEHCAMLKRKRASQSAYDSYTEPMRTMTGRGAVVPDDKLKHVAWGLPVLSYHVLCLMFVVSSHNWFVLNLSPEEANCMLLARIVAILGPSLARRFGLNHDCWLLPKGYVTIKSKCFAHGDIIGRVCEKHGHSCARKICSYSQWPKKLVWRRVHRAIDTLIKRISPGAEVWGLDDAALRLRHGLDKLHASQAKHVCKNCGDVKQPLTAVVADASQFYEEVEPFSAVTALGNILVRAASKGWQGVSVGRAKKRQGFLTSAKSSPHSKFCFFDFKTLLSCFHAAMAVPFVTFGKVVCKMRGLPIGGLCSKIATSAVLTEQEEDWFRRLTTPGHAGFRFSQGSFSSTCLHLRYIDDVFLASKVWCRTCLLQYLSQCYSVSFEASPSDNNVQWLDMILDCDSGMIKPKGKQVIVPPPWGARKNCLRPIFFNCLRRACLVSTHDHTVRMRMMSVLCDFAACGWSNRMIDKVVFTTFRLPYRNHLQFLQFCMRNGEFRQLLTEARSRHTASQP